MEEVIFSIGFEDREVVFTDAAPHPATGVAVLPGGGPLPIAKVLKIVENSKALYVVSPDPEVDFRAFCAQFHPVNAAGGLVTDAAGDVLMIFRNGHWDLPKGHCEEGETAAATALREVEEECGLTGLTLGPFVAKTRHTYLLQGEWVLKTGHWFRMTHPDVRPALRPQTEEGIACAEWIPRTRLTPILAQTFTTIRQVFAAAEL